VAEKSLGILPRPDVEPEAWSAFRSHLDAFDPRIDAKAQKKRLHATREELTARVVTDDSDTRLTVGAQATICGPEMTKKERDLFRRLCEDSVGDSLLP